MHRFAVKVVLATMLSVPMGAAADGIGGGYLVQGDEPTGVPYEGVATITRTGSTTATIEMQLGNGPASGRCMITETQLACYGEAGPTHYLMSLYELQQDGRLTGIWTHSGLSGFGQEVLTPQ